MVAENCTFTNNTATVDTPGFGLSYSSLTLVNSTVTQAERSSSEERRLLQPVIMDGWTDMMRGGASDPAKGGFIEPLKPIFDEESILARQQSIAGFFYVINMSEMQISETKLVNTYGTVASAIYASSGSKVSAFDVDFSGLPGPDDCNFENSGVIVGELADSFTISNSTFSGN